MFTRPRPKLTAGQLARMDDQRLLRMQMRHPNVARALRMISRDIGAETDNTAIVDAAVEEIERLIEHPARPRYDGECQIDPFEEHFSGQQ